MEKFYRIDKSHKINEAYNRYSDMSHRVNEAFKEFCAEIGREAPEYFQYTNRLCVIPTAEDRKKFEAHFKAHDLGNFKMISEFSKMWVKKCTELELKTPEKPRLWSCFNCNGKSRSGIVPVGEVLYARFESDSDFSAPEGFKEIPGSEFYRVIEEHDKKIN